jgi:anti-sigma factor RsiW
MQYTDLSMGRLSHPEELIDRARRGRLAPKDQLALERHLDRCLVCVWQLSLARRFERQLAPRPRDELASQRAAKAAIYRMQRTHIP